MGPTSKMPPRIPAPSRLGATNLCFRPAPSNAQLHIISSANLVTMAQRRKHKDPYALAQAKQRKDANLSRRAELQERRKAALGDPVRGITTPFLESFDHVGGSDVINEAVVTQEGVSIKTADNILLNHFLRPSELEASIKHSHALTEPVVSKIRDFSDPVVEAEEKKKHEEGHAKAVAAMARIVSLANASQKDKIRVLANQLETKGGKKDKVNKRNLRLMVHKRQKLLTYLRRKERGGERWQHLIETLGLTEGTWKGEISL